MNTGIISSVMCLMMFVGRVEMFVSGVTPAIGSHPQVMCLSATIPQSARSGGGGGTSFVEPGGIPSMGIGWTEFQAKGSL